MGTYPPNHCPYCGTELEAVEAPSVFRCESCDGFVFHNPTPNFRVMVVDGDSALLVEIIDEYRVEDPPYDDVSEWMLPGGHAMLGEQPEETAARELQEETNLTVDPDDLVLFDAVARQVAEGVHSVVMLYAVDRADVTGPLEADSDAGDAKFWTPDELADSACTFRELHAEPDWCREFESWVERARAALDGSAG